MRRPLALILVLCSALAIAETMAESKDLSRELMYFYPRVPPEAPLPDVNPDLDIPNDPMTPAVAYEKAEEYLSKGLPGEATECFERGIAGLRRKKGKSDKPLLNALVSNYAELLRGHGDDGRANKLISEFCATPVDSAVMDEALNLQISRNYSAAIELYKKIIANNPGNGLAWARLGFCYHSHNDWNSALVAYDKAYVLDPKRQKDLLFFQAEILDKELADREKALEKYQQYLVHDADGKYATDAKQRIGQLESHQAS